ncbi:hypothetical protein LTV02_38215 [Nocardia yamanashiensis]|uniref:hypothetical protein n=1 Tax=Nocardia yamanashiensis TaxID=209247 RepID=UPI000835EE27|nr:hypothetical protein [Nocardia yamanashiensis]UGT41686.1 hypothetical protein LTV02_38215 [Nocardia yamanashiensis]
MEFRSATAAATLVIGALTAATGLANAQPAAPGDATPERIAYSTKLVDKTVVTTLKGGTFTLTKALASDIAAGSDQRLGERDGVTVGADGAAVDPADVVQVADVKDGAGHTLLSLPLVFHVGTVGIPVASRLEQNDTVLALTPEKPAALAISQPLVVKPVASQVENQRALNDFTLQFSLGTSIGTFVGTALGATIGCIATLVAGCIGGLATGASVGGIIGSIAVGGPTLIAAGIDLLTTMNAADGTTKWADKPKTEPAQAQAQPSAAEQPK